MENVITCSSCARMDKLDWERKYCPVTASCVHRNRRADKCKFFLNKDLNREKARRQ